MQLEYADIVTVGDVFIWEIKNVDAIFNNWCYIRMQSMLMQSTTTYFRLLMKARSACVYLCACRSLWKIIIVGKGEMK